MARSYLCWGPQGSTKSSFGLAEAGPDNPISYHLFEPGGFKRAATRLGLDEKNLPSWVRLHKYVMPTPELDSMGQVIVGQTGRAQANLYYRLDGWVDVIAAFNTNYMTDCKDGYRPVVDTVTELWNAQQNAIKQQLQDATNGTNADYLDQLRYGAPNSRMMGAMHFARNYDLDAVFVAHEKEKFNPDRNSVAPTEYIMDSWKKTEDQVDCSLRFRLVGNKPVARIEKGAEVGLDIKGLDIEYPTLTKVSEFLDCAAKLASHKIGLAGKSVVEITAQSQNELLLACAKALHDEGIDGPDDVESILAQGKMLGIKP